MKTIKMTMMALMMCLVLSSCSKEDLTKEVTYNYKYEVSGSGGDYSMTIQNTSDNTQQWSSVGNGWVYSWTQKLTVDGDGTPLENQTRWLYVSAQNNNSSGDVTVKIYRNNVVVATNTGYGAYTIATVSGNY
jgi:hypothetical protein